MEMVKYDVRFFGREVGAIGIRYKIHAVIECKEGATKEEILLKTYEKYDHIQSFQVMNEDEI